MSGLFAAGKVFDSQILKRAGSAVPSGGLVGLLSKDKKKKSKGSIASGITQPINNFGLAGEVKRNF